MARRFGEFLAPAIVLLLIDLGSEIYFHHAVEGVSLMFQLYAGREDCFYESMDINKTMYVEYNVIGTGMGDGDVNFQLMDPRNRPVVTEFRKPNSRHELNIPETGLYRICFDNTYSHFTPKQIAFSVGTTNSDQANWQEFQEGTYFPEEGSYDIQVNEIKERIDRVRTSLNSMEAIQEQYRLTELRDRSIAEHNFERVNYWSTIFLVFSVTIGTIQVFLLKGLFDPHYDVRSYVKKIVRK